MDYAEILNTKIEAKKTEQGKQVAQQRTLILKLKQVVGELLTKRDQFMVAVCEREEGFQHRETANKEQVAALKDQLKALLASTEERHAASEECFKKTLEALLLEKEELQRRLDAGRQDLEYDHTELEGAKAHLEHMVARCREASELAQQERGRAEQLHSQLTSARSEAQLLRSEAEHRLREDHGALAGASELSGRLQRALDEAAAEKERLLGELQARVAEEMGARDRREAELRAVHEREVEILRKDGEQLASKASAVLRDQLRAKEEMLEQASKEESTQLAELRVAAREQEQRIAAQEIVLWKLRDEKQREIAVKQSEVEDLERKLGEARNEASELRRSRNEKEAEEHRKALAMEREKGEVGEQLARRAAEAAELDAKAHSLTELLAEAKASQEQLRREFEASLQASATASLHSEQALQETRQEVASLRERLAKSEQVRGSVTDELDSAKKQMIEMSEKLISEQNRTMAEMIKDKEREVCEKKALEEKAVKLDEQLRESKTQIAVLQSQVQGIKEDLGRKEKEKDKAQEDAAKLSVERDLATHKIQEMEKRLDEKELQIRDAVRAVAQAQEMQMGRSKELSEERDKLFEEVARRKEEAKQSKYELDKIKSSMHERDIHQQDVNQQLQNLKIALQTQKEELVHMQAVLEEAQKAKATVSERLAVLAAEYRTYKQCNNSPANLAEQLQELLSLEAVKASAQSRIAAAEEDAETQRSLVARLREQVTSLQQKLYAADNIRRKLHNELQELRGNIRVFARVRPSVEERCALTVDEEANSVGVPYNGNVSVFKCDRTFSPRACQEDVFSEVSQFIQSALDGYNVSLFAYGQTGSGKTHTMFGSGSDIGIIPRSIALILSTVEAEADGGWKYDLHASFLEIYQEHIRDLLSKDKDREVKQYKILQGENGQHDVSDLVFLPVHSQRDVESMLSLAESNRSVARTEMNERSSRSHTIFSLRIAGTRNIGGQAQTLHGSLHLVDLAGSERLAKSQAAGERLKEAQAINKSLSALSDVFVALSKKAAHIPYRNSKLTYLLQPCLSGDGKALVIANLSPCESSAHESLCTLRFASTVGSCELGKAVKNISTMAAASSSHGDSNGPTPEPSFDLREVSSERSTVSTCSSMRAPSPIGTPRRPPTVPTPNRTTARPPTPAAASASATTTPGRVPALGSRSRTPSAEPAARRRLGMAAGGGGSCDELLGPADVELDM